MDNSIFRLGLWKREIVGDTVDIAVAILLATLQKMIVSSMKALTFEYTVRELSKG